MKKTNNFLRLLILSLVFWSITGCDYLIHLGLASPQLIEINRIAERKNKQTPIRVQGKVEKIVPLLNSSAYELKDLTGSIWIVTKNNLPKQGETITIEALPQYQNIIIGQENLGEFYLQEIKEIEDKNSQSKPNNNNIIPVELNKKPTNKFKN
jgi:hypothetical protein